MHDDAFYTAAREAAVRFVRDVARMPGFPQQILATNMFAENDAPEKPDAVLRVVATDRAPAQILARPDDVWLVLQPFHDITNATPIDVRNDLLQKRLAVVVLLVRLAASPEFTWDAIVNCCVDEADGEQPNARQSFWLNLFRTLDPHTSDDRHRQFERDLVVLSRARSLRFLLAVDSNPCQVDIMEMLDQFLSCDAELVSLCRNVLKYCSISPPKLASDFLEVDIGLSFSRGRFSEPSMIKLVDALTKVDGSRSIARGIRLRVVALRFRQDCLVPQKAVDALGRNLGRVRSLKTLTFGGLKVIKPQAMRAFLQTAQDQEPSVLERLGVSVPDVFPGIASSFRAGEQNTITELDVRYDLTAEHAAWLAFGFFHVDSRSRVTSLRIQGIGRGPRYCSADVLFTHQWVDVFSKALKSLSPLADLADVDEEDISGLESPLADLAELEGESEPPEAVNFRMFVELKPETSAKTHPYAGAKLLCKVSGELERLGQIKNLVAVVVSGFGVGWVPVSAITSSREQRSIVSEDAPAQSNGRIKSLVIDPTIFFRQFRYSLPTHRDALLDFLAIIGASLETLHLPFAQFGLDDLERILHSCPNLIELNLGGNSIRDISPLREAYKSGRCRIASLGVGMMVNDPMENARFLAQIAHLLQDPTSHPLRILDVSTSTPVQTTSETKAGLDESLDALMGAMEAHPTLDYGQLTNVWSITPRMPRLTQSFSTKVKGYPPPRRCQLAFLSVITHQSNQHIKLMSQFDSHVIATIQSFSNHAVKCHLLLNVLIDRAL